MTKKELITIGGLLLDYMAVLSKELLEADSRTDKVYLKEKIETIRELVEKIGEDLNNGETRLFKYEYLQKDTTS